MKISPLTPEGAIEEKEFSMPAAVVAAFNAEIVRNLDSTGRAKVTQTAVVNRLMDAGIPRKEIFDNHYLDVEALFRKAGWKVSFDKAVAWGGDNYDSFWLFEKSGR